MRDPNNPCLFCITKKEDIIEENEFAYAAFDSYPVSNQHCLNTLKSFQLYFLKEEAIKRHLYFC